MLRSAKFSRSHPIEGRDTHRLQAEIQVRALVRIQAMVRNDGRCHVECCPSRFQGRGGQQRCKLNTHRFIEAGLFMPRRVLRYCSPKLREIMSDVTRMSAARDKGARNALGCQCDCLGVEF